MKGPLLLLTKVEADAEGHIAPQYRGQILNALRKYPGIALDIEIRRHRSQRSLEMNAYLHAVPFPIIAEHVGDSIDGVKLDLMGECFGWTETAGGHVIPVKPHTSSMTVEESKFFLDWLIPFAAQKFGIVIPLPDERLPEEGAA